MRDVLRLGPGETLTDQVESGLRSGVASGAIRPGELHSAYEVADLLGVSRSPVREALLKLAESGLIQMARNRGFTVVRPDPEEIREIFELRLLLEVPAARRAALTRSAATMRTLTALLAEMRREAKRPDEVSFMMRDKEFHAAILREGGNRRLVAIVDGLREQTRSIGASTVGRPRGLLDIADEHRPILAALRARDGEAAAAAVSAHLSATMTLLLRGVEGRAEGPAV